jgi:hypothetical protein
LLNLKFHLQFFDSSEVKRRVDKTTRKVLSRFGAFVRRTSRQSIRKRKRPSQPGEPPSSHTGLLKRFIFFGYEPNDRNVVIGPIRLSKNGRGDAPSLLEYGGVGAAKRRGKSKRMKIRSRPFMRPAFDKEQSNLPKLWHDSIK